MTIKLEIEIDGLCMWVPDGDTVHVLMPQMKHHPRANHYAVIAYDKAQRAPDQPATDRLVVVPVDGEDLTIGAVLDEAPSVGLPAEIALLDERVEFVGVDPNCVFADVAARVNTRLHLRAGAVGGTAYEDGDFCFDAPPTCAKSDAPTQRLASRVSWRIDVSALADDRGGVDLRALVTAASLGGVAVAHDKLTRVYPPKGSNVIRLYVRHAVRSMIPVDDGSLPLPGQSQNDHFVAYYDLNFGKKPARPVLPLKKRQRGEVVDVNEQRVGSDVCGPSTAALHRATTGLAS